jgi:hypothetical protein
MRPVGLAVFVFVAGFTVIALRGTFATVFLFLVLIIITAYLRDGRERPYRELADNIF